jgi:hypothetical protein
MLKQVLFILSFLGVLLDAQNISTTSLPLTTSLTTRTTPIAISLISPPIDLVTLPPSLIISQNLSTTTISPNNATDVPKHIKNSTASFNRQLDMLSKLISIILFFNFAYFSF